jgi:dienelactone hydrolase
MRAGSARIVLCLVCSLVLIGAPTDGPADAAPAPGSCDERSWIGGTTEWCAGKLVYRDYVYDDNGADTRPAGSVHGTSLNRGAGDVDHREHGQALNSADLLTLRLWRDGNALRASFHLNTLFKADRTIAALAIDTDDDRSTGGGRWHERIDVGSDGWDRSFVFDRRDTKANVITGAAPMPTTGASTWRVQAAVALGDGTPMNVAFRPKDSGNWWEDEQSAALAAGDVSAFGQRIRVGDLLGGTTHRPARDRGPGLYERVYTSKFPIKEGVNYDGLVLDGVRGTYQYLGPHQPYGIYVPKPDRSKTYGLQFALHGASAAHASLVNLPGMQYAFGDHLRSLGDKPRLIVVPLGRGPANSYVDYGERDVLDVLVDVEKHYAVDDDRVFAGGYSMGGAGTYWLSSLYPHIFAGGINWVGYTTDCLNGTPIAQGRQRPDPPVPGLWGNEPGSGCNGEGNNLDYLEGTRHVPMAMLYAGADELVWANHAVALMRRYEQLGYEHVLWFHPAAEHLTFALVDDWIKEATWSAGRTRTERPAHVTYRTNPYLWFTKAGLQQDSAYWVRELRPAKPSRDRLGDVTVDLVSHRCAPHATYGIDVTTEAGPDPLPWIAQRGAPRKGAPIEQSDRISGVVHNAGSFVIDVAGACMGKGRIEFDIAVDGPTTVRFSDGRPEEILRP